MPEPPRLRTLETGCGHGFLGDDGNFREGARQHLDDDPLGGEIGLGHRGLVVLVGDLERIGIDAHHRLAAGECGAQRDIQKGILFCHPGHAAFAPAAPRMARHNRSGVSGMSR